MAVVQRAADGDTVRAGRPAMASPSGCILAKDADRAYTSQNCAFVRTRDSALQRTPRSYKCGVPTRQARQSGRSERGPSVNTVSTSTISSMSGYRPSRWPSASASVSAM